MCHGKLLGFIAEYTEDGLCRVYLKSQLLKLCKAYRVNAPSKSNKKHLATMIVAAVKMNSEIPNIAPVDVRQYQVTENVDDNGHIRLRIRLAGWFFRS